MSGELNAETVPGVDGEIGVMPLGLGQCTNSIQEIQRRSEVLELQITDQAVALECPLRHLGHDFAHLFGGQPRSIGAAGSASASRQVGHIPSPEELSQSVIEVRRVRATPDQAPPSKLRQARRHDEPQRLKMTVAAQYLCDSKLASGGGA